MVLKTKCTMYWVILTKCKSYTRRNSKCGPCNTERWPLSMRDPSTPVQVEIKELNIWNISTYYKIPPMGVTPPRSRLESTYLLYFSITFPV